LLPSSEDWSRILQQFGNDKDGMSPCYWF
jgi:hypothetical protein